MAMQVGVRVCGRVFMQAASSSASLVYSLRSLQPFRILTYILAAWFAVLFLRHLYPSLTLSLSSSLPVSLSAVCLSLQANLPNFLLDHVIGASRKALEAVRNPSALRIHAVDVIKVIE